MRIILTLIIVMSLSLTSCSFSSKTEQEKADSTQIDEKISRSVWKEGEFHDEFDNPTGEKYLTTTIEGKFSNSATTDDNLSVIITVDKDSVIYFKFAEYGSNLVKREYLHGKVRGEKGSAARVRGVA